MSIDFKYPKGATPLDPNELAGLIPTYITTQGELDSHEQSGTLETQSWVMGKKHKNILTDTFMKQLHKRMFKAVWRWAGVYRKTDKSIGVHWPQISTEVKKLLDDTNYWLEHNTYPMDELAARFHHRLVVIHPFPNGNGRFARLMTDTLLATHNQIPFSWGSMESFEQIGTESTVREKYIKALRDADQKSFTLLLNFVRS